MITILLFGLLIGYCFCGLLVMFVSIVGMMSKGFEEPEYTIRGWVMPHRMVIAFMLIIAFIAWPWILISIVREEQ
jgi:hypothetical protein